MESRAGDFFKKEKGGCCVLEMPSQQFSLKEEKRTDSFHEAVQVISWFPAGPLSSLDSYQAWQPCPVTPSHIPFVSDLPHITAPTIMHCTFHISEKWHLNLFSRLVKQNHHHYSI